MPDIQPVQGVAGGVAQPVSGTVTAAQATAANLNATVTGTVTANAGTGTLNVAGTGTAGSAATGVVTVQGIASGTNLPVSGTVTANAGTGSFTVAQATAANLNATVSGTVTSNQGTANTAANAWPSKLVDSGCVNVATVSAANALKVDGSAVTQPVSGTVTSNQGTAAATAGAWPAKVTDGTTVATVNASSTGLNVSIRDTFGTTINATQLASLPVFTGLPNTANILCGSATANAATIITIPTNRVWEGWITLSASLTGAAGAQTCTPTVTIQSAGTSFPASATILCAVTFNTAATATTATPGQAQKIFVRVGAPTATNTATLQLNQGAGTAPTTMIATAAGVLL